MIMFTILVMPLGSTQVSVLLLQLQQPIKLRILEEFAGHNKFHQAHAI